MMTSRRGFFGTLIGLFTLPFLGFKLPAAVLGQPVVPSQGTINVRLKYTGRLKPMPTEDPWSS